MSVYIIHFDKPISGMAGHYTGYADNVDGRF